MRTSTYRSKCLKLIFACSVKNSNKKYAVSFIMVQLNINEQVSTLQITEGNIMTTFGKVIDYMQNLPLPNIPEQEVLYYRQLWVCEFGVHDIKSITANGYFPVRAIPSMTTISVMKRLLPRKSYSFNDYNISYETKHLYTRTRLISYKEGVCEVRVVGAYDSRILCALCKTSRIRAVLARSIAQFVRTETAILISFNRAASTHHLSYKYNQARVQHTERNSPKLADSDIKNSFHRAENQDTYIRGKE
ncbi:hypothetical protein PR048_005156 [Dryococelus australis]|uniref:Uncharacterized protein n=1 Tax=Dryococelus australis TaxID=614101 RepID=A0ABQ9I7E0_9NEOP|nr:hypothetical protein PR048_005156 [Dryococelus australis]